MTTQPPSNKAADVLTSIILFFITFAIWQTYDLLLGIIKPNYPFDILLNLAIPALSLAVCILFIIIRKTQFRRHGYRKPTIITTRKTIQLSLACAAVYIIMMLAPGLTAVLATGNISEGFTLSIYPLTPLNVAYRIILGIAYAVTFSLASESIFRGYIFRNLVRHTGFFTSLYATSIMFCLHQVSIKRLLEMSTGDLVTYIFMEILVAFAAGLFLGYLFYKTGWSLIGPVTFQIAVIFFLMPDPIVASTSLWWISLTFQVIGYAILILAIDTIIKEPMYRRKKYGLEG